LQTIALYSRQVQRIAGAATPATVVARIRSDYLLDLLEDNVFFAFAKGCWMQHVLRLMLKYTNTAAELKGLERKSLLEKIYLYGMDEQFEDLTHVKTEIQRWETALALVLKPIQPTLSALDRMKLDWIRHHLTPGRIFGIDSSVLRLHSNYCGFPASCQPVPDSSLQELLAVCSSDELLRSDFNHKGITVFKVVNDFPSRRVVEWPHHKGGRPLALAAVLFDTCYEETNMSIQCVPTGEICFIDVKFWLTCFADFIQCLWRFDGVEWGGRLNMRRALLKSLNDNSPVPQTLSITKDDRALSLSARGELPLLGSNAAGVSSSLQSLIGNNCFDALENFMEVVGIANHSAAT
jgi:hypothetical protein